MNGIEKIKEKILEEARINSRSILLNAEQKASEVLENARKKAETETSKILEKAHKDALEKQKRLLSTTELELKKQRLEVKQALVEETFQKALERFHLLSEVEYRNFLATMILETGFKGNVDIIFSASDYEKRGENFVRQLNLCLGGQGIHLVLSAETRDIEGGAVIRMGEIEVNLSFLSILKVKRDELEADVVKILFQNG